jgi:hypothetical protein
MAGVALAAFGEHALWGLFEPESPLLLTAPNVPTATVQQIF